jgi:ABC-type dipeptide/oligopeptide/nickel transport system ATPase component
MPPGCAFAARCPLAGDDCRAAAVPEQALPGAEGHAARCLRAGVQPVAAA